MDFTAFTPEYYPQWDRFVAETPGSTFYHQSAWFDILDKTFRHKQVGCLQMEGNRIVGGLPLFEVRRIVGKGIVSSPFRDRGGVLCLPDVNPWHILKQVSKFQGNRADYIMVKQMNEFVETIVDDLHYKKNSSWITTRVDLSQGRDRIWQKLKNNAQGPVKQAQKNGVEVCLADNPSNIDSFYRVFLKNRKKLGIPSFPKKFFTSLWNCMHASGKMCLMLAKLGETTLAGIWLLIHKDTVIDGYAASLPEYHRYRANDLLVWRAIEWACENGYKIFDFGADSQYQKNLLAFKRKWGGEHKTVYRYYYLNKSNRLPDVDSSSHKYTYFRKGLSLLPTPLFSFASNLIVSRFG